MLTIHHLSKFFGVQPILKEITFSINAGERLGLIGPNGCGKTTLLRILAGQESPDGGVITRERGDLRVGYLPQGFEFPPNLTVSEVIRQSRGDSDDPEGAVAHWAAALSERPDDEGIQRAYDAALQRLQRAAPGLPPAAILPALGLDTLPEALPAGALSGGQKTRLSLACVLLGEPNLLLLDEPTNHLDIPMLEWLENWLARFPGAALIVSHDRTFLDRTVNAVLDLDDDAHTLRRYTGNYSAYLEQKLAEHERQQQAYADQTAEIRRMKQDIARTKQQSLKVELSTTPRQPEIRRIAKKVAQKALSREKKLDRYQESDERVEKPRESWQMKLEFGPLAHRSRDVLILDDLAVGYAGNAPLLRGLNQVVRGGERVALTGPNGCGKTTLLRTIAGRLPPLAGQARLGANIRLGYMSQEQELLDPALNALETIQRFAPLSETEGRAFLHFYLFAGDDPLRPVNALSFGERARLSLACLVAQGCNFLLLDEPINHLDIPSRARFEQALAQFDGTVLAVVHDRYFIERFASEVWVATAEGGMSIQGR